MDVLFADAGAQPLPVSEGQELHLKIKRKDDSSGSTYIYYGQNGKEYETISENDPDFTIETSNFDGNCTNRDRG